MLSVEIQHIVFRRVRFEPLRDRAWIGRLRTSASQVLRIPALSLGARRFADDLLVRY